MPFTSPAHFIASSFSVFRRSLLQTEDLPLTDLIDQERFQAVFEEHNVDFGSDPDSVYTPAITLWALLSQALFSGEQRSCKAAVLRVASFWASVGRRVCKTDTAAYCRARLKIPFEAVRDITKLVAADAEAVFEKLPRLSKEQIVESMCPDDVATVKSIPIKGRMLLVDGFTVTAADTPENQEEYPQNPAQKKGLGFPILRGVSLTSMQTGLLIDAEIGPYSGKESGETALLWKLLKQLKPGDTLVADSYYCTYWLIAACQAQDVHVVMKNHDKRDDHPIGARRINKDERIVTWERGPRPDWMSIELYNQQPATVELRLVDIRVEQAGYRTKAFTVATTIVDHKLYPSTWIGAIYRNRWLVELDIRSMKCSLGMDILRAKTPEMVRTEFWSCLLAYNLIRLKMLQSSIANGRDPRGMSFTTTMQLLGTNWLLCAVTGVTNELAQLGQEASSSEQVGHRPGRNEPRANKRRPKVLALMTKPRHEYQAELGVAA
jgi:hypothetical protein